MKEAQLYHGRLGQGVLLRRANARERACSLPPLLSLSQQSSRPCPSCPRWGRRRCLDPDKVGGWLLYEAKQEF